MTRARDVSRLITTPPNIYATDSETSSAGYLTNSSASSILQADIEQQIDGLYLLPLHKILELGHNLLKMMDQQILNLLNH